MNEKLFTNLSPMVRWIMLPFACILVPVLVSLILGLGFMMSLGINAQEEHPILFFIKDLIHSFVIGFAFVRSALYISPSHTQIVMQVIRIIGVCLIALISLWNYEHQVLDWKNIVGTILVLIGVLIKLEDEEEMIEKEVNE